MANWIEIVFKFLHDNHLPAFFLGTGLGASLSKIVIQLKRIFLKNNGDIFKTAEEVTEKISECLAEDKAKPTKDSEAIAKAT